MAVLVVVAAVLVVSYASSMRAYLQQRSQIDDLRSQIASSKEHISSLEREKRRWDDPAYVEAQTRERLGWVLPGETSYQVIDRNGKPLERSTGLSDPDSVAEPVPDPWWGKVYGTLQAADHPEKVPVPATRITPPSRPGRPLREPATSRVAGVSIDPQDSRVIEAQLGRTPRSIHAIGHRCPCGHPDVVTTEPRLEDGTPFPTTFYLTCPRAASLIGTLEGSGLMREMADRLGRDPELAAGYRRAHEAYLAARAEIGEVPEISGVSAGGMPDRVKCLHVLAGQALAQGPGVNPLGDEVVGALGDWWRTGPCVTPEEPS